MTLLCTSNCQFCPWLIVARRPAKQEGCRWGKHTTATEKSLGFLKKIPACTDLLTKPWVLEAGVDVLNQPFYANGNLATTGGCFASQYLAAWVIARLEGLEAAKSAMHYVAPVGEKEHYVDRAMSNITPYLPA